MSPEPIPINQYNCNDDQWWAGRVALLLEDVESDPGAGLSKGDRVTIIRKVAAGQQVGHAHEIGLVVRSPSLHGPIEVPCTSLSLTDDRPKGN